MPALGVAREGIWAELYYLGTAVGRQLARVLAGITVPIADHTPHLHPHSAMTNTNVLITGVDREIGRGLFARYLARPNYTVIATLPDPSHPTATDLQELPKGEDSRLVVIKADPLLYRDAEAAATEIRTVHNIEYLDLVVATSSLPNVVPDGRTDLNVEELLSHLDISLYGFLAMYQAVEDLLKQSSREPMWVTVGYAVAGPTDTLPFAPHAYAPCRAGARWLTEKIDMGEEVLGAFAIHPGFVTIEMGMNGTSGSGLYNGTNGRAGPGLHDDMYVEDHLHDDMNVENHLHDDMDVENHLITVDDSCDGILKVIDDSNKEDTGGKLLNWLGDEAEW